MIIIHTESDFKKLAKESKETEQEIRKKIEETAIHFNFDGITDQEARWKIPGLYEEMLLEKMKKIVDRTERQTCKNCKTKKCEEHELLWEYQCPKWEKAIKNNLIKAHCIPQSFEKSILTCN